MNCIPPPTALEHREPCGNSFASQRSACLAPLSRRAPPNFCLVLRSRRVLRAVLRVCVHVRICGCGGRSGLLPPRAASSLLVCATHDVGSTPCFITVVPRPKPAACSCTSRLAGSPRRTPRSSNRVHCARTPLVPLSAWQNATACCTGNPPAPGLRHPCWD